jgi:hypothetical protein
MMGARGPDQVWKLQRFTQNPDGTGAERMVCVNYRPDGSMVTIGEEHTWLVVQSMKNEPDPRRQSRVVFIPWTD